MAFAKYGECCRGKHGRFQAEVIWTRGPQGRSAESALPATIEQVAAFNNRRLPGPTGSTLPAKAAETFYATLASPAKYDAGLRSLEIARNAGVVLGWGTDLIGETQNRQTREFAIRSEVESATEILRAMYQVNPRLCRLEGQIGRLTPGARADIVLVNVNPIDNIAKLADPSTLTHVIMAGQLVRGI